VPTEVPRPTEPPAPEPTRAFIEYTTPEWFQQAVLYQIFVRSYADSDGDGIGDLNGITANLDYIASLSVDTIWLTPIHPSPSQHGYDVTDYFAVHPDFGTLEDFQVLVAEAHSRDMKVIIDFVSSHLSNQHPLFQDAYKNPDSPYDEWFGFLDEENATYAGFANLSDKPRFNLYNPEVIDYMVEIALFWMDLDGDGDYADGVDGIRVDNAVFPPHSFFKELRQRLKHNNPEVVLLAEVWSTQSDQLLSYFEDEFDALFNFPLYNVMSGQPERNLDGMLAGAFPSSLLTRVLETQAENMPPEAILVHFFSNHDTNRLASELDGDPDRLKLAAATLAVLPDTIAVYYGEEIGMPGEKGGPPFYDNYRREPMDWYASEAGPQQATWFNVPDRWNRPNDGISVEEQSEDPNSLLNSYRDLLALRKALPALAEGDFQILENRSVGRKSWVLLRQAENQALVAFFNFNTEAVDITVEEFPLSSPAFTDWFTGQAYPGAEAGQPYTLNVPAAGMIWFIVDSE
jgi:glycosidase